MPQQRDLTFANGAIIERDYTGTATGGQPPFSFASTPSRTRTILDRIQLQTSGGVAVPFFRYYAFDGEQPDPPRQTAEHAAQTPRTPQRVVQVTISFQALASRGGSGSTAEPLPRTSMSAPPIRPTRTTHPLCI